MTRLLALALLLLSFAAQAQPTVAGATPASFRVTESGAAEYRIPIRVPPGIAGMEPKLALVYNSQAGNGPLGVGWSLEGLSSITRCPRTLAQDGVRGGVNYDGNDRYCLDGQRLMAAPGGTYGADGTEYRTERESFSKIVSYGSAGDGPAWFKVWTKSGQIMEYGYSADSRIEARGKASVRVWAVNRISDRKGNGLGVTYNENTGNGEFTVHRIDYGGNASAGLPHRAYVRFQWDARSDGNSAYVGGSQIGQTVVLRKVLGYSVTDNQDTYVKGYVLNWAASASTLRSVLTSVQECDSTDLNCLPPVSMGWQQGGQGWSPGDAPMPRNWNPQRVWSGDFNGDGKTDLVSLQDADAGYGQKRVVSFMSDGAGGWIPGDGLAPRSWNPQYVWPGDFDGDGRADLLSLQEADAGFGHRRYVIFFGSGASGDGPMPRNWNPQRVWTGDFNGDGRTDLVSLQDADAGYGQKRYVIFFSDGAGGWTAADAPMERNWNPQYTWTADLNGDGRTDLIGLQDADPGFGQKRLVSFLSDGAGGWIPGDGPAPRNWNPQYVQSGDFDGDGRTDLFSLQEPAAGFGLGRYVIFFGNGASTEGVMSRNWNPQRVWAGDFSGDGKTDLVGLQEEDAGFGLRRYVAFHMSAPHPDLVTSAANSLGALTTVTYKPLTDAAVYAKGTGAAYPIVDLQPAQHVVSSVFSSNGTGGGWTTSHQYGALKAQAGTGRGALGFLWWETTDQATGLKVRTENRQDWPYVGLPSGVTTTRSSGAVLRHATHLYSCKNPLTGDGCTVAAGNRYFPFVWRSEETSNDLDSGAALPKVTTDTSYDLYGNPTSVTVSTSDGHSRTTTNTFASADTIHWLVDRLIHSTVLGANP